MSQPELSDEAFFDNRNLTDVGWEGQVTHGVEITDCSVTGSSWTSTQWTKVRLRGNTIDRSNLSGMFAEDSTWLKTTLQHSRATGLHWINSRLRHSKLTDNRLDLSAWRFTTIEGTEFRDCDLSGADFTNATLTNTRFLNCNLTEASFHHVSCTGVTFEGTTLTDIDGIRYLAGSTIDSAAALNLAPALASALGITISHGDSHHP